MTINLLFDISALMDTSAREWEEYQKVGTCYLPQVIYDEIKFLCDRSGDPRQEQTARTFIRFQVQNNWQLTSVSAPHPVLAPPPGEGLSKKARLALITAQCAYGFAQENQDKVIVFISNTQPLLQRIQAVKASNLCGLTTAQLLQWSRTQQCPPFITQQLQAVQQGTGNPKIPVDSNGHSSSRAKIVSSNKKPPVSHSIQPPIVSKTQPSRTVSHRSAGLAPAPKRSPSVGRMGRDFSRMVMQLVGGILVLTTLAIAGGTAWRIVQPQSFNQFWNQQVQPLLQPLSE